MHRPALLALLVLLLALPPRPAAAQQVTPPKLVTFVQATLPADAPRRAADVVLLITIGADGAVTEVEIRQGAGEPWDTAAMAAARQFVFEPALVDGAPVPVKVPFTYTFRVPVRRGPIVPQPQARRDTERSPEGRVVAGRIAERGSRTPLGGVQINVRDPRTDRTWTTITDSNGRYALEDLPAGRLELTVLSGDHQTLTRPVTPAPRAADGAVPAGDTLYLAPGTWTGYGTVVKADRRPEAASEIALTDDELRKIPGTFGDPTRVVQTLPGVSRSPFGLGYYVVRGASFENTGFFIDGHPAYYLYHLLGGPSVIHPQLVGRLNFYPGGYPARYGRFATGIISLETAEPPDDRWHLDLELDYFRAGAMFSTPFDDKKGQLTVSLRRSYYDLLLPLFVDNFSFGFTDYQLRLSYDLAPGVRAFFGLLGAMDFLDAEQTEPGDRPNSSDADLGFHRIYGGVDVDLNKHLTWKNSLAWEYDYTSSRRTAEGEDSINAAVDGWYANLRSGLVYTPLKNLMIEGGLDAFYVTVNADLKVPSLPPLGDPRPPEFDPLTVAFRVTTPMASVAPYVLADWEVVSGVRLLPGLRVTGDFWGGEVHWSADPKLAVRWQLDDQWTLKTMAAIAHQPPAPFQADEPFGDPNIPPVRGSQASLGFEWVSPDTSWEVSVEGFFNYLHNMARPANAITSDDGELERVFFASDMEGRAFGGEVLIRKRMGGRHFGWLSYTIARSERLRPPEDWELFELDQTHNLSLAWSVLLGNEWTFGARFNLTSGNPYYPIVGSRYDADRDSYEPIYAQRPDRIEVFHRLDVRLDKRIRFETWMMEVYLDIQNLYNAGNPESPRYSYDFSYKTDGLSIPILPTLGVRAAF